MCYCDPMKGGEAMTDMRRALARTEYDNREHLISHLPYDREAAFYRSIQAGNREEALRLFTPLGQEGFGRLSDDPLRNLRYHLIISVAFITRYCMAGGLAAETAFNLSDLYIRRIDVCRTEAEIHALHRELVEAYAERMHAHRSRPAFSRPVLRCTEYIHTHMHERITVDDLCTASGLSRSYLTRLFHRETGRTPGQYITDRRIDAARQALEYTGQSISDIAHVLAFSSESHLISVFRRSCGMTPGEYRRKHRDPQSAAAGDP